jgi:SAM-dependent methyltransferase
MTYESADFMQVDKVYEPPTYICDLRDIPVENGRFDLVICNQVMEHIPAPVDLLRELRRVTKPGCAIWMSAPLFFEEHEQPHDFYRYTQFAWRHLAEEAGLDVVSLEWMEGYLGTLAYQLGMAARRETVQAISASPGWAPGRRVAAMAFGATCFVLGRWADRQDRRWKLTSTGMPKNYCAVLRVP